MGSHLWMQFLTTRAAALCCAKRPIFASVHCTSAKGTGTVYLGMTGFGGAVDTEGLAVAKPIGKFLRAPEQEDVLSKLRASGAAECHVFIAVSFGGAPWQVESSGDTDGPSPGHGPRCTACERRLDNVRQKRCAVGLQRVVLFRRHCPLQPSAELRGCSTKVRCQACSYRRGMQPSVAPVIAKARERARRVKAAQR